MGFPDAVRLQAVRDMDLPNVPYQPHKRIVVLYLHGMSNSATIQEEIRHVDQSLSVIMSELLRKGHRGFSYHLFALTYHHLIEKDQSTRMKAHTRWGIWDAIKKTVLTRFPIAMCYWTESTIRREINRACKRILKELTERFSSEDEEVSFIVVGYTTGSIVSSLVLGELWKEQKGSLLPDIGRSHQTKLYALFTLGCPLPWFGDASDFQLPRWSSEENARYQYSGWTNFLYRRDIHSIPLRKCAPCLAEAVRRDVEIAQFEPLPCPQYQQGPTKQPRRSLTRRLIKMGGRFVSEWTPIPELLASLNGCYLQDKLVWQEIGKAMEELLEG